MPFQFEQTKLPGVVVITPRVFEDYRGSFLEVYQRSEFEAAGISVDFVQENQSRSIECTLRGLHFQNEPAAQAKLIRVNRGEVFDVSVDIRRDSPTFGQWVGLHLSEKNGMMLFLPRWCAHGFCVLSDEAEILYKVTAEYAPELEGGVLWNDPDLGIDWPIRDPTLSERDRKWPLLRELESSFVCGPTQA